MTPSSSSMLEGGEGGEVMDMRGGDKEGEGEGECKKR
jgi:hypothetical protein